MIAQVDFDIPPKIAARIATGELIRWGGVVRDTAGHIVIHLKETSASRPNEEVVAAAAGMLKKPVVIAGLATLAVVEAATAAVAIVRKRKRAMGHSETLAQTNSIDLDESPEPTPASTDAPVVDLRRYREVQRRIFDDAAPRLEALDGGEKGLAGVGSAVLGPKGLKRYVNRRL